jgi:hypothetical protein
MELSALAYEILFEIYEESNQNSKYHFDFNS